MSFECVPADLNYWLGVHRVDGWRIVSAFPTPNNPNTVIVVMEKP